MNKVKLPYKLACFRDNIFITKAAIIYNNNEFDTEVYPFKNIKSIKLNGNQIEIKLRNTIIITSMAETHEEDLQQEYRLIEAAYHRYWGLNTKK